MIPITEEGSESSGKWEERHVPDTPMLFQGWREEGREDE